MQYEYEVISRVDLIFGWEVRGDHIVELLSSMVGGDGNLGDDGSQGDVDSLFTNVPVTETIDIIRHNVYQHQTLPPPTFPMNLLKKLLLACTTKSPFLHVDNSLYLQAGGVSMGSPLGVTLANFYMVSKITY